MEDGRFTLSDYVVCVPANAEYQILHSTLYKSTAVVSTAALDVLGRSNGFTVDESGAVMARDEFQQLVDQEIVVPEGLDEGARLRYMIQSARFDYSAMEVAFLTTRSCNFRCRYCTESGFFSDSDMDSKTIELAVDHLRDVMTAKGTKHLKVGFYGGEPLLNTKAILHSAQLLREMCEGIGVELLLFVITNGFLLVPSTFDALAAVGIQCFQITLDGPQQVHDSRRSLEGGGGTWQRIMDNAEYLVTSPQLQSLEIRINVDSSNEDAAGELIQELAARPAISGTKQVSVYVAPVVPAFHPLENWNQYVLQGREKARAFVRLWRLLAKSGFRVSVFPDFFPCGLHVEWAALFDPSGDVYSCAGFLGMPGHAKGALPAVGLSPRYLQYLVQELPADCMTCKWAPFCGGGCAYISAVMGRHWCERAFYEEAYPEFVRISTLQDVKRMEPMSTLATCL